MNPAEAARLLGHASSFDARKPSQAAAIAWSRALHDVPLDQDALDAVALYYGDAGSADRYDPTARRWLEPHHVRHYRRQIRAARLAAANTIYDGNPDETPDEAARNQRALTRAAADGDIPPQTVRAAIGSGPRSDATGRARAILKAVGRQAPSRRPEFTAPCPYCGAAPGTPCRTGSGKPLREAHPSRIEASHRVRSGSEPPSPADVERELERRRTASRAALERHQQPSHPPEGMDHPAPPEETP